MLIYIPDTNISPHFKMYEIVESFTASRLLIDNTPTAPVLENAERLANEILEPIRNHFGVPFSPQSWFRCEALEKAITQNSFSEWCIRKGKPVNMYSWNEYFSLKSHPTGEAVDIELPGVSNDYLYQWIHNNIPVYDQLIREFPKPNNPKSGWVHVSLKEKDNRHEMFTIG